jgi:hypothetical protein
MNAPQIHLMMNHVPVIGVLFAALALAVGLLWRNAAILRLGLAMLVLVALAAIPVFLSGEPAEETVEDLAGVSHASIESHEDAAKPAMVGLELLGLVALIGLLLHRGRVVAPRFAALLLIAVIALSGGLAWTAHLGGQIRHPELRGGAAAAPAESGAAGAEEEEDRD